MTLLQDVLAANPAFPPAAAPSDFPIAVVVGAHEAALNAAARHWIGVRRTCLRSLRPVEGVPGCKTCEAYTVIDLAASSTPGDRAAAMAYMRDVSTLPHVTRTYHSFLVYDMHLVHSRCFLNLRYVRVLGTTSRPAALCERLRSHCAFVRLRTSCSVPARLGQLASAAVVGDCVASARRYAHEALKTCLDPALAYRALLEASTDGRESDAARLEHLSLKLTRPVHALELMALLAGR